MRSTPPLRVQSNTSPLVWSLIRSFDGGHGRGRPAVGAGVGLHREVVHTTRPKAPDQPIALQRSHKLDVTPICCR